MTKILRVEERYKFPRGVEVSEVREITYNAEFYNDNVLNHCEYPYECVNGWYVIDAIKMNSPHIVVTYGRVNWE